MNISSVVIQCRSDYFDEVKRWCEESDICDYHFGERARGKIVVTIEGEDVNEEIKKLVEIQKVPHVIAADMMMTYQEDLDDAIKELESSSPVPELLTRDDVDPDEVVYHGDLKRKKIIPD